MTFKISLIFSDPKLRNPKGDYELKMIDSMPISQTYAKR